MRVHLHATVQNGWRDVGVLELPDGSHWTARASAEVEQDEAGPAGGLTVDARVELRGGSGTTVLWSGAINRIPTLITLPITLPGDRLVLVVKAGKGLKAHFEVAWIERGPPRPYNPCQEGVSCART